VVLNATRSGSYLLQGHHGHEHGAPDNERHNDIMLDNRHRGHAHSRQERGQGHTHDVNIVGIFIHILGDAVNSLAVSKHLFQMLSEVSPPH
jgi:zinc transporter 1